MQLKSNAQIFLIIAVLILLAAMITFLVLFLHFRTKYNNATNTPHVSGMSLSNSNSFQDMYGRCVLQGKRCETVSGGDQNYINCFKECADESLKKCIQNCNGNTICIQSCMEQLKEIYKQ